MEKYNSNEHAKTCQCWRCYCFRDPLPHHLEAQLTLNVLSGLYGTLYDAAANVWENRR